MATQYQNIMAKLDEIQDGVNRIWGMVADLVEDSGLDLDAEAPVQVSEGNDPIPRATRTHAPVHNLDGEIEMVPWRDIDERVIEATRIAAEDGEPWELYMGEDRMVRISTSEAVAHKVRKSRTHQQPVPRVGDREVDVFGVDDDG